MFDSLLKAAVGIVTLPLDVAADVVTMGGAMTEKREPYTTKKVGDVMRHIKDATE